MQFLQQLIFIFDVFVKIGYPGCDFIDPVGITAAGSRQAQLFGHLAGHIIFIGRQLAVSNLYGIDEFKHLALAGINYYIME